MAQASDAVWLPVLPSMKGFGPALVQGAGAEADKAGKPLGKRLGTAIGLGVAAAGAGIVAAGTALYKVGEVFDDVADTIRVGTGATGDALDGLIDSAKRVGQTVPADFEKVGSTVADINTRMGLSGDVLETVASQYLEAGRILGEDVDIGKTSAAFNAFKIEGEDVIGAMDHLFQVSQATGMGMNELADAASRNAPAMETLGFSFEETTAMVGSFDKAGLNSSQIMASMSKGLVTLAKDGEEPASAFKRVQGEISGFIEKGDEAAALELASKVFGTRGATQFIGALKSGALNLEDMGKAAGQTADSILGAGEETMDFAEQWQLFKNNTLVWLEPLGARVFGALGTIMGEATKGVERFGAAWEANDGKISSSGLPGLFERLGYFARQTFDYIKANVVPTLQGLWTWVVENKNALLALIPAVAGGAAVFGAYFAITKAMATYSAIVGWFKATTLAQQGLNAAMRANPIGIIVTLIGVLVGALIWLYQNNETARNIMNAAWASIQKAISFAWNSVIKPVFDALVGFVRNVIAPALTWLWERVVRPVFQAVGKWIGDVWRGLIEPVFSLMVHILTKVVGPAISGWWEGTVRPVFKAVGDWISTTWNDHIKPVLDVFGRYFEAHLAPKIRAGVEVIKSIWSGIQKGFATPINWVIRNVWNNGIVKIFDDVSNAVGYKGPRLGRVAEIGVGDPSSARGNRLGSGGVTTVGAFAKGGLAKGWAIVGEEGPELVNFTRPGRVYTAEQTRQMLGSRDLTPEQSRLAAGRSPSEALLPMGDGLSKWDIAKIGISNAGIGPARGVGMVLGNLMDGAKAVLDPILGQARKYLGGAGRFGSLLTSAVQSMVGKVLDFAKGHDDKAASGSAGNALFFNGPLGKTWYPGGRITSHFGPRWGSVHSGTDFAGVGLVRALWNGIVRATGWNIAPGRTGIGAILDHAGGRSSYYGHMASTRVRPGQVLSSGDVIGVEGTTGNSTGVHLHQEVWERGRPVNPLKYLLRDSGGELPRGLSMILNNRRESEWIVNKPQIDQMAANFMARGQGPQMVALVLEDGTSFPAYVQDQAEARFAHMARGTRQFARQMTGA
ncbi:phage tail tape measure protein [Micrococcus terreus]|uniref:phage tail tape measure protein n=1 Tax=Micrococcus terreus TaxID=574650 RepID=UPI0033E5D85E